MCRRGEALGASEWFVVDQSRIELFADATEDHYWIHVDPVRAAEGPYGSTIAHGYLTLSLVAKVLREIYDVPGKRVSVNYGLNKVRFPSPVLVGQRIRGVAELIKATPFEDTVTAEVRTVMEIEGGTKPACVAESLVRYWF